MLSKTHLCLLFSILIFSLPHFSAAQCTSPINTFPYYQNFEANDGNWVRSSSSHWEWGQVVSKPVISTAGGGSKCWLVGGFSGSFYNSGSSYLQSPCFDLSSLISPQLSFKIFWETERKYDGATFEYSLDGGNAWQILGSTSSNMNCLGDNWFNYDPVYFLGEAGWSGNIQQTSGSCLGTGGSGAWVTAKHTLSSVAGSTSIIFRFVFAAGTTCNNFDGFAIDDIRIEEAPVNGADFTYSCSGNNTVSFVSSSKPCSTGVSWDFGDPGSPGNFSSATEPTHTYSSPGNYTVTLTTTFSSGSPVVVMKQLNVINATSTIDSIRCNGDQSASITIQVLPSGTYNYTWDTNPVQQNAVINNLGPGTYTVNITGTNTCSIGLPVTITEPPVLDVETVVENAKCNRYNGSVSALVSGGTPGYTYAWSTSANTASISMLPPGNYSLNITDSKGCTASVNNLSVQNIINNLNVSLGNVTNICPGQILILDPGNFASYKWQDNSSARTFSVSQTGSYSVKVTDADGCSASAAIAVVVDCPEIYFPSAFTPNGDTKNDSFGPVGNLAAIHDYKLTIYGRWGEVIFTSRDPFQKWDGTYKGKTPGTQLFIWQSTFSLGRFLPESRSGTVMVIH